MSTLEKLISDTGGCGRFQICQVMAINSIRLVSVWGIFFMAFGNYNPGWRCHDPHANATFLEGSFVRVQNASEFSGNHGGVEPRIMKNVPFSGSHSTSGNMSLTRRLNRNHLIYTNGSKELNTSDTVESKVPVTETQDDGYQMKCEGFSSCSAVAFDPSSRTIVTQWGLACERTWIVSLITSIQMAGLILGCVSAGQISERFGRRKALFCCGAVYSVANFVAIFSVSWPMYTACLFFVGAGGVGVLCIAVVYCFEFLEPRWRGILGGLPLINLSLTFFSFLIFLERDWRYLHATVAVVSALCMIPMLWVPESMRWLAVHGRFREAKAVVDKIASINKYQVPGKDAMEVLHSLIADQQTTGNDRKYNYWDLIREKSLRGMTIKLAVCWMCQVTVYFALSFSVKVFSGDFYVNLLIYTMVEIPSSLLVGPLANRWGRKRCGFVFSFVSSLACLALVVLEATKPEDNGHAMAVFVLACAAKSTLAGGRSVMVIVTGELPPTVVRSLCYAFCMLSSRLGAIIAPYLVPEDSTFPISFTIMTVLSFLTCAIFLTIPETNNRPMADTVSNYSRSTVDTMSQKPANDRRGEKQQPADGRHSEQEQPANGRHV